MRTTIALNAATRYVRAAQRSVSFAGETSKGLMVPLRSNHAMALDDALYSTGSVIIENRADNAIIIMPAQNISGKTLMKIKPMIITHVDHFDVTLMTGTRAVRSFSGP